MSSGHKNNANEYYSNYVPNFEGDIVVQITPPENVNPSETVINHSPCALVELDIWKLSSICAESNFTLNADGEHWDIYSVDESSNYSIITLENKVMIMNLLLHLRNELSNLSTISISNILLVGILKRDIYGIKNHNIIRLLLKDDNLETIEMTIIEKGFNLIDILYNKCVSIDTIDLSLNSSLIPKRTIYNLEYKLNNCKLSLMLSSPSGLDIYEKVDLIGNQLTKSDLKNIIIHTKHVIPLEIYMNDYDCKYIKVVEGETNSTINLECISNEEYIKKNIVIKLINFDSNNELYLGKIGF